MSSSSTPRSDPKTNSDGAEVISRNSDPGASASASRPRRRYDRAFKHEAVKRWRSGDRSAEQVAKELGVSLAALYAWAKQQDARASSREPSAHSHRTLKQENARLRADVEKLRIEREVLKKTLTILAESQRSALSDL